MSQVDFAKILREQEWTINVPLDWSLDALNLNQRSIEALAKAGLVKVRDVVGASLDKLSHINQFGNGSFRELLVALRDGPLAIAMADEKYQRAIEQAKIEMAYRKYGSERGCYERGETPQEVAKYAPRPRPN